MKITLDDLLILLNTYGLKSKIKDLELEILLVTTKYYAIIVTEEHYNELIYSSVCHDSVILFSITQLPISKKFQIMIELNGYYELSRLSTAKVF